VRGCRGPLAWRNADATDIIPGFALPMVLDFRGSRCVFGYRATRCGGVEVETAGGFPLQAIYMTMGAHLAINQSELQCQSE
jgi:hypothetical protein